MIEDPYRDPLTDVTLMSTLRIGPLLHLRTTVGSPWGEFSRIKPQV